MLRRRNILGFAAGALASAALPAWAVASDLVSHEPAAMPGPPKRILLGDGHLLLALALVHPSPGELVCAWQGDLIRHSKEIFSIYNEKFPVLKSVPVVGEASPETFSVEAALASRPDIAIFGGCYGPGPDDVSVIRRFEAAGIPVVFVDFYEDPLNNTAASIRLIGKVLGGEAVEKAERYARWHEGAIATIRQRIETADPDRPSVMVQANAAAPGWNCCWVSGGAGLGPFIELAGGTNIGGPLADGRPWVQARREFVLAIDPGFVFVTGGGYLAGRSGLVIGPGTTKDVVQASLESVASSSDASALTAVQEGRLSGLWHLLHATPFNVVAAQAIARRIHPTLFDDMDPAESFTVINRDFLSVPIDGIYALDLER